MSRKLQIGIALSLLGVSALWFLDKSEPPLTAPNSAPLAAVSTQSTNSIKTHLIDQANLIPKADLPRFEQYMGWILRESGIDVRIVFLPNIQGQTIENKALDLMAQLQIGQQTGQQRGLLLLYDVQAQRLKVETGYGLEGIFPDVFINYLAQEHAKTFFAMGDVSLGLRLTLRLLQHRIREAVIGETFDPRSINKAIELAHLSGGAGINAKLPIGTTETPQTKSVSAFAAADSPSETYRRYLEWLNTWPLDANADFLTPASRQYLASLPKSPAYVEYIFLSEYGKKFQVIERGDLALLYFTNTPFASPHFFVKTDGRWRMDLAAEVQNTREHTGGEYTWAYYGQHDQYTSAFADQLITIQGYRRIQGGDNRPLKIYGDR